MFFRKSQLARLGDGFFFTALIMEGVALEFERIVPIEVIDYEDKSARNLVGYAAGAANLLGLLP